MAAEDARAQDPRPRRPPWDAMAAVIAALIGLLALGVSVYTAMLQRQQVRAEVWPYLQPAVAQAKQAITIENKGVGPAIVRSLRVYVDGRPRRSWPEVFDALGLDDLRDTAASTVNGVVLAPGETIQQVGFDDAANFRRLLPRYPRIALVVCYCSTLAECRLLDEREATPERRHRDVASCPARGADEFIDNALPPQAATAAGTREGDQP